MTKLNIRWDDSRFFPSLQIICVLEEIDIFVQEVTSYLMSISNFKAELVPTHLLTAIYVFVANDLPPKYCKWYNGRNSIWIHFENRWMQLFITSQNAVIALQSEPLIRTQHGGRGGQAIVINFITLQGEGGQKRSKHWVRTKSMAPYSNQNFNHIFFKIHHI